MTDSTTSTSTSNSPDLSTSTTGIKSNRLLLDPNLPIEKFKSESLKLEFKSFELEDEGEVERILADLEDLTHEFQIWSTARIFKENNSLELELNRGSESILVEEERQEAQRIKLEKFIRDLKVAFGSFTGLN